MSGPKGRFGLLFLGIFIGIVTGVLLAYWLNDRGWDISRVTGYFNKESKEKPVRETLRTTNTDNSNVMIGKRYDKIRSHEPDTIAVDTSELTFDEFAELYDQQLPDSVIMDAYRLIHHEKENGNDVVVAKDELLFTKSFEVAGLQPEKSSNLDSILLDDRGSKKHSRNIVQIEFWKSPINYHGYKWDTRKLVLFGLFEFDNVRMKYLQGMYYLAYGTLYYRLEQSDTFLNLSPATDNDLVKQLNSL